VPIWPPAIPGSWDFSPTLSPVITGEVAGVGSRTVRAIHAVAGTAGRASPPSLAQQLLQVLVAALRADGGALLLMDPQTGLFWTGAVDRLPAPTCHPFFASELEDEGVRTFRRLARDRSGASALSVRGEADDLFRTRVLVPFGYGDELRVVCRDAGVAWGGLSLWRRTGVPRFCPDDERTLDDVAPVVGAALRDAVLRSVVGRTSAEEAHGVLIVEDGVVVDASPEARSLLREIDEPTTREYRPLDHLLALSRREARFSVVVGTSDGHWLTAHGTSLTGTRTVLVLTTPSPADLLGALVAGAGLTPREVEVTRLLCRGLTDAEIARELTVSAHTAHDHVRAVRTKLGVRNRAEVASRVFADHYFERFLATASVVHDQ
jgi:DNA-binding CsgD family transcriptional regulator